MPIALASVRVGDAIEGPSIDDLIRDANHLLHHAASVHYGRDKGCEFAAFTRETGPKQDRAAFEACMRSLSIDEDWIGRHLGEFDEASRPVAIVHWWLEG